MSNAAYEACLDEISRAVSPQKLAAHAGPPLIRDSATSLQLALDANPRDVATVRTRVVALAADALRVIRAIGESDPARANFAKPTEGRLPGMIDEYAANTANALIADDDPPQRLADEMLAAAAHYVDADPRSIHGSASSQLEHLFRVVGLAGHGLAA